MIDYYASFVNMDHRTDRLSHITHQLQKAGIQSERTRGMHPNEYDGVPYLVDTMRARTPGAIGCHFSQVKVMKKAQELGKHAFVMEDDIVFCQDIQKRLEYISVWMDKNEWDVFWLGSSLHINPPFWHKHGQSGMRPNCSQQLGYDAKVTNDPRIIRTYGAFATFAYIVNVNSIDKILTMFDKYLHESIGIDWLFIKIQPQLNCFSFVPGCCRQIDNMSDIGKGMTVWSGHLKLGPYVYQENMDDFNPETFNWAECR